jgi:hypothetical protein
MSAVETSVCTLPDPKSIDITRGPILFIVSIACLHHDLNLGMQALTTGQERLGGVSGYPARLCGLQL